jgi:orotate phosphoribosyltransferase
MNSETLAKYLLEMNVFFFSPDKLFTWASGIKSPVYCDNRVILSYPKFRNQIEDALTNLIKEKYSDCEVVAGTSTAGIPHAAFVADRLSLPMVYVRTTQKNHGREKLIEGKLDSNKKIVVIEDLISTGGSAIKTVEILRSANSNVLGVASIFTYNMQLSIDNFKKNNIKNFSLVDYKTLLTTALKLNIISSDQLEKLKFFK